MPWRAQRTVKTAFLLFTNHDSLLTFI